IMNDTKSQGKDMETVELDPLNSPSDKRTRFQVNRVRNESNGDKGNATFDSNNDQNEDDDLLGVTDRTFLNSEGVNKSLRHMTREALPRLDNYRNIMSIQAANRPTLDELYNSTLPK
ncbi:hypothetical protein GWI33_023114, partial [Rhynchophorus ferrugineus]